jgi:hypothetical protein
MLCWSCAVMSKIFRRSNCQKASDGTDGAHRLRYRTRFGKGLGLSTFGRRRPSRCRRGVASSSICPVYVARDLSASFLFYPWLHTPGVECHDGSVSSGTRPVLQKTISPLPSADDAPVELWATPV